MKRTTLRGAVQWATLARLVWILRSQCFRCNDAGTVVMSKRINRSRVLQFFGDLSPCLVGLEACPSAHYWGRELQALGDTVKLMPPSYVKAYLSAARTTPTMQRRSARLLTPTRTSAI